MCLHMYTWSTNTYFSQGFIDRSELFPNIACTSDKVVRPTYWLHCIYTDYKTHTLFYISLKISADVKTHTFYLLQKKWSFNLQQFFWSNVFNLKWYEWNDQIVSFKKTKPEVNISSAAGLRSTGTGSVYAMTKAAMVQLTKNLACPGTKTWDDPRIYGLQLLECCGFF